MYRRGPLQHRINNDEQWEKLTQLNGLIVVDVYSRCFGPCSAMMPSLRKIRRQARVALHFAVAESDKISYLEQFRNKSEPTWIFLAEGKIVNVMYGANAPKLIRRITDELKNEAAVKAGARPRSELDITDLPREEVEEEVGHCELVEQQKIKKPEKVIILDEEFLYRPF